MIKIEINSSKFASLVDEKKQMFAVVIPLSESPRRIGWFYAKADATLPYHPLDASYTQVSWWLSMRLNRAYRKYMKELNRPKPEAFWRPI